MNLTSDKIYKINKRIKALLRQFRPGAILTADKTAALYEDLLEINAQLRAVSLVEGGKDIEDLYKLSINQKENAEYLREKLRDLKLVAELNLEIIRAKKSNDQAIIIKKGW